MKSLLPLFMFCATLSVLIACDVQSSPAATGSTQPKDSTADSSKTGSGVVYGSVTDASGKVYKTVKIGTQEWMAENLNDSRDVTVGVCFNRSKDSCSRYGRLYTWAEAMQGASRSESSPSGVQGICPSGWHLPSTKEWQTLEQVVGLEKNATKLKAKWGWSNNGNGTDSVGFGALPSSNYAGGVFGASGTFAAWWSATSGEIYMNNQSTTVQLNPDLLPSYALAVRCVKDAN